jgi:hypothetical protein
MKKGQKIVYSTRLHVDPLIRMNLETHFRASRMPIRDRRDAMMVQCPLGLFVALMLFFPLTLLQAEEV